MSYTVSTMKYRERAIIITSKYGRMNSDTSELKSWFINGGTDMSVKIDRILNDIDYRINEIKKSIIDNNYEETRYVIDSLEVDIKTLYHEVSEYL